MRDSFPCILYNGKVIFYITKWLYKEKELNENEEN